MEEINDEEIYAMYSNETEIMMVMSVKKKTIFIIRNILENKEFIGEFPRSGNFEIKINENFSIMMIMDRNNVEIYKIKRNDCVLIFYEEKRILYKNIIPDGCAISNMSALVLVEENADGSYLERNFFIELLDLESYFSHIIDINEIKILYFSKFNSDNTTISMVTDLGLFKLYDYKQKKFILNLKYLRYETERNLYENITRLSISSNYSEINMVISDKSKKKITIVTWKNSW